MSHTRRRRRGNKLVRTITDAFQGVGQTAAEAAGAFEDFGKALTMVRAPDPWPPAEVPTLRAWHRATCQPCQNDGPFEYDPIREEYTCGACGVAVTGETLRNWTRNVDDLGIVQQPGTRGPGTVRLERCPSCRGRNMRFVERFDGDHYLCLICSATFTQQEAELALMERYQMVRDQGGESEPVRAVEAREAAPEDLPPEDLRTRRLRVKRGT